MAAAAVTAYTPPSAMYWPAPSSIMGQSAKPPPSKKPDTKDVDNDDTDSDEEEVVDRKSTAVAPPPKASLPKRRTTRFSAPSGCGENHLPMEHGNDVDLQRYATPDIRFRGDVVAPWKKQFDLDQPYEITPPIGHVDYLTRIRSRTLSFSVQIPYRAATLKNAPYQYTCTNAPVFIECTNAACHHVVVPLRISVLGHRGANCPPQDVEFQLTTPAESESKELVHAWFPTHVYGATTNYGTGAATTTQHELAYVIPWNSSSTQLKPLFTADTETIIPTNLDLFAQLHRPSGLMEGVKNSTHAAWSVRQPDEHTNVAPNWMSYFVAMHVGAGPKGTTGHKRHGFTSVNRKTKQEYFKFLPGYYEERQQSAHKTVRATRPVMNLSTGITGVFTPTDRESWNSYAQWKKEKSGGDETMRMTVDVRLDYMVIGGVRPPPLSGGK